MADSEQSGADVGRWRAGTGVTAVDNGERHVSEWAALFRTDPRER